jgi:hypothetical protein
MGFIQAQWFLPCAIFMILVFFCHKGTKALRDTKNFFVILSVFEPLWHFLPGNCFSLQLYVLIRYITEFRQQWQLLLYRQ